MNDEVIRMINMKPVDAIKLEPVEQPEYDEIKEDLPIDSVVRYLYKPGEVEGDNRYRATDPIWSVDFYYIDEIRSFENQQSVHLLKSMSKNKQFTRCRLKRLE